MSSSIAEGPTCAAFPDGIPQGIWDNKVDHRVPIAGDHGIVFEPAWLGADELVNSWFET